MLIMVIQKRSEKKREVKGKLNVVITGCSEKLGKMLLSDSESIL